MKFNLKSFKPNRSLAILLAAVGLGLLAALIARSYMSNRMEQIESGAKGRMVEVVVARTDMERGAILSGDTVAIRQVPLDYAHQQAITPASYDSADGEVLAFSAKGGQMILWPMLEAKKAPSFAHRVEVGRRAMTVPVDEISSISGMLEPGDVIDLLATVDRSGRKVTFALLQNVQVLATGQRSIDDPRSGERRDYSTVTLDTTPKQAQQVIAVREEGRITALLRNPQDKEALPDGSLNIDALLGGVRAEKGPSKGDQGVGGAGVPILYGGASEKFSDEQLNFRQGRRALEVLSALGLDKEGPASLMPTRNTDGEEK